MCTKEGRKEKSSNQRGDTLMYTTLLYCSTLKLNLKQIKLLLRARHCGEYDLGSIPKELTKRGEKMQTCGNLNSK